MTGAPPPPPRLPPPSGGGRPEPWGPAETLHLIDAYEERWHASRRGQLRAQQWEEVSGVVAARIGLPAGHSSAKTGTQCRHKVEKLRQRYRSERAQSRPSAWPFFARMHRLERGPLPLASLPPNDDDDDDKPRVNALPPVNGLGWSVPRVSRSPRFFKKRAVDFEIEEEEEEEEEEEQEQEEEEDEGEEGEEEEKEGMGLLEVVREFGEGLMRLERRRMELMRELERERMEMEARRAEMVVESSRCLAEAIAGAFSAATSARKAKRPRGP